MTYQDLIDEYKGLTAASDALGISKQTIHNWRQTGIPEDQQVEIQKKNSRFRLDREIVAKYRAALKREARAA